MELDLPIFSSNHPLLHSIDAQFNLGIERSSVGIGTPGYEIGAPYAYNQVSPGLYILGPNTLSSYNEPASSGAEPYSVTSTNSHASSTFALSYQPIDALIFRFSVASGYVPPTYAQLLPNANLVGVTYTGSGPISDPKGATQTGNITSPRSIPAVIQI